MEKNKTGKYFKYAIGEIVLVVIGILIALQINNWNEDRKTNAIAQNYLNSLKQEFRYNKASLDSLMVQVETQNKIAVELTRFTGPAEPEINEIEFGALIAQSLLYEIQYRPSEGVLNEILNSGKLGVFKGQKLKDELSSWSGVLTKVRYQEMEIERARLGCFKILYENINLRGMTYTLVGDKYGFNQSRFKYDNLNILQNQSFENIMVSYIMTLQVANPIYYQELSLKIDEILKAIDKELNK